MFPQPAPRGPGVPAGTKKARFGGRKGPRQTGLAATTECEDRSDAAETEEATNSKEEEEEVAVMG